MSKYFDIPKIPGFKFVIGPNFMTQAAYMIVMPVFFITYSLLYNPFDIQQYYENAVLGTGFSLVMITCIIMVTLGITRTIFTFLIHKFDFNRWHYLAWCVGELFVISAFVALYSVLVRPERESYLLVLETCMKFCYLVLVHPYILILLVRTIMSKNEEIAILKTPKDTSLMKFHDDHKRLKLSITPSSILYIKNDLNYVMVNYLESGRIKSYQLRCSMKSIEPLADGVSLVRCHRSYFVNPQRITVLRKDKDGFIFAELNAPEIAPIPVSKTYYKNVSVLL